VTDEWEHRLLTSRTAVLVVAHHNESVGDTFQCERRLADRDVDSVVFYAAVAVLYEKDLSVVSRKEPGDAHRNPSRVDYLAAGIDQLRGGLQTGEQFLGGHARSDIHRHLQLQSRIDMLSLKRDGILAGFGEIGVESRHVGES